MHSRIVARLNCSKPPRHLYTQNPRRYLHVAYRDEFYHPLPEGHTFPMRKYPDLFSILREENLLPDEHIITPQPIDWEHLKWVHDADYVEAIRNDTLSNDHRRRLGVPCLNLSSSTQGMVERWRMTVQGTVDCAIRSLTDHCITGNISGGYHHAFRSHPSGYCAFNDVAVAVEFLERKNMISRCLVIDLDTHQGDGNAAMLSDKPNAFTFSMHGAKNFPLNKMKSDLDVELPDRCDDEEYLGLLSKHLPDVLEKSNPDIIFYLAGVDICEGDRLGRLKVSREGLVKREEMVLDYVWNQYKKPLVLLTAGGYAATAKMTADLHAEIAQERKKKTRLPLNSADGPVSRFLPDFYMKTTFLAFLALTALLYASVDGVKNMKPHPVEAAAAAAGYKIGRGIYDITGPVSNVGLMGYAMFDQIGAGISSRLRARAFIFEGPSRANSSITNRVVFVSTDSCMIFASVKQSVIARLQKLYGETYSYDNVILSGEHTHSGPAGFSYYLLYDLSSRGFQPENFEAIVNGIVKAISMAHNSMVEDAQLFINHGEVLEANINRSPTAYLANPEPERAQWKYDVDKDMTLLRIEDSKGNELGMINWFAVHGTSMNNTNLLTSPDNKGFAAYSFEKYKNGADSVPGMGPFVAAFAQSNEGDVSPNTKGATCPDGTPCESVHSTCGGYTQGCIGKGPGKDDFESMTIIGTNQFKGAKDLYEKTPREPLSVSVDYAHTFLDMQNVEVGAEWNADKKPGKTCVAALGLGFAGGTTDGPGDFDFRQGANSSTNNPYWSLLGSFIFPPNAEEIECQRPKPILLNVGKFRLPAQWVSDILPIQVARIGDLVIVAVPGEFTTMSGRRLRKTVLDTLQSLGAADEKTKVIIAGLSNDYSHYIATREEYSVQRYEGASTIFGPHTLAAYQQEYSKLITLMTKGIKPPHGPQPADLSASTIHIPFLFDIDVHPFGKPYGTVLKDVLPSYNRGALVNVTFQAANLRRDFRTQDTFLTIEKSNNGTWTSVRTDADFDNRLKSTSNQLRETTVTIEWYTTADVATGQYRIRHFGTSKDVSGNLTPFVAKSSTFNLV
ncbi:hypothetical protein PROFUN_01854 [Planoprotostelium fungivorum]|uniref:ceramidase n=1 Tax=Planoprotostelium fungivorum TaxID=1890364 RepID=A0A2P6NYU8_9EUKA|nr:hypothetical protein PROFUN_01854 [Planoprotostelium fungivorum]